MNNICSIIHNHFISFNIQVAPENAETAEPVAPRPENVETAEPVAPRESIPDSESFILVSMRSTFTEYTECSLYSILFTLLCNIQVETVSVEDKPAARGDTTEASSVGG